MLEKINDIQNALANNNILSALALALTIPDICGKVEYPNERSSKTRYINWFDKWTSTYFSAPAFNFIPEEKIQESIPYFTGEMCYALRCSYLHAGNAEMSEWNKEKESEVTYNFQLVINGATGVGNTSMDEKNVKKIISEHINLNVIDLCNFICLSAEKFYRENDPNLFKNQKIKVFDYQLFLKSMNL